MEEMNENLVAEEAVSEAPSASQSSWEADYSGEVVAGKKGGAALWIVGIAVLLIVAAALVCLFVPAVNNKLMKAFLSPEKYYQRVEKSYVTSVAKDAKEIYKNYLDKYNNEAAGSVNVKAEFTDSALNLMGLGDINLKSVELDVDAISKNKSAMGVISAGLNGEALITMEEIITKDGLFFRLPDLNPNWIGMETDENESLEKAEESIQEILDILTPAEVERIIMEYSEAVYASFSDVEEEKTDVDCGGLTVPATVYTMTIDDEFLSSLSEALEDKLSDDKTIEALFEQILTVSGDEDDYDYDDVVEQLCGELKNMNIDEMGAVAVMKVTVDNSGKIIGRELVYNESEDSGYNKDMNCGYMKVVSGKEYALSVWNSTNTLYSDGWNSSNSYQIDVEGEYSGSKLSGDITLTAVAAYGEDNEYTDVYEMSFEDFEIVDKVTGRISGKIEIEVPDENGKIVITANPEKNSQEFKIDLIVEDEKYITFTVCADETSELKGDKIKAPADYIDINDYEALEEYYADMNQDFINKLMENEVIAAIMNAVMGYSLSLY